MVEKEEGRGRGDPFQSETTREEGPSVLFNVINATHRFCILPYSLNHPPTTVQLLTHTTHQRYACAFFFLILCLYIYYLVVIY